MTLSAVVLLKVDRGSASEVAQSIVDLEGVDKVFSVAGRFDLVVNVTVKDMEELSRISNECFDKIQKISTVETLVSMKIFSKKLLEQGFSVGL
jgi:DNA-binding Lrp family transcriptional regulator